MKTITWKMMFLSFCLTMVQLAVLAQDNSGSGNSSTSSSSTTTTTHTSSGTSTNWLASPWLWIVGGAVFILLLVALLGGRNRSTSSDTVRVTKTVERDSQ